MFLFQKWPLTKPVTKLEALIQTSGEAQYANDIPCQPGELWAAFVLASEALSTIEKIDPSEALVSFLFPLIILIVFINLFLFNRK